MRFEQRIIVATQTIGRVTPRDSLVEHSAHGDPINITSMDTKADDTATPLVHDYQHPVRLACEGFTPE